MKSGGTRSPLSIGAARSLWSRQATNFKATLVIPYNEADSRRAEAHGARESSDQARGEVHSPERALGRQRDRQSPIVNQCSGPTSERERERDERRDDCGGV